MLKREEKEKEMIEETVEIKIQKRIKESQRMKKEEKTVMKGRQGAKNIERKNEGKIVMKET